MRTIQVTILPRYIVGALGIAVLAGTWDVWWHAAVGRNTFWEPPHLLLYTAVIAVLAGGWWGWVRTRERAWRRLAIAVLMIPLAAPFDDLWHRAFGVEDLRSPFVIWSPPHLVLIGALIASFALVLPLLARDRDAHARRFFGAIAIAGILALLSLVVQPLDPIGPWHLLGFTGAGVIAAVLVGGFLAAQRHVPGTGAASLVAIILIAYSAIGITRGTAPEVELPLHDHPPFWLAVFALLAAAALIDSVGRRWPSWVLGMAAGLLWSVILFGFVSRFLEPVFQYGARDMSIAIAASVAGGACSGLFLRRTLA